MESIIIGIAGSSGSGKTNVVRRILEQLTDRQVSVISQDQYHRYHSDIPLEKRQPVNFDHSDAKSSSSWSIT